MTDKIKTCPICLTDYHTKREHCPVCNSRHVTHGIYFDGDIQIVVAHGVLRANQELRRSIFSGMRLCDAE